MNVSSNDLINDAFLIIDLLYERFDPNSFNDSFNQTNFEDLKNQISDLQKFCFSDASNKEILQLKKRIISSFKIILQYSCIENSQRTFSNFKKNLTSFISSSHKNQQLNTNLNTSSNPNLNTNNSSAKELHKMAQDTMKENEELIFNQTQIHQLNLMKKEFENAQNLQKFNDFLKEKTNVICFSTQINSSLRMANDMQYAIELMNKTLKSKK
ncbi:hypothetical protein TRFO_17297 [Tritrichomonas foetus]|uniref:Uncharacterized protein n=1 Tax=Tritrichomonas foetus TaxID=1144522 RepID=A0A1J4KN61_9EUKA|nr:hypothetical protein TRFO_17297 [Tritrichomonas foetus]|eukprot:OHT12753.1 hypothetical protein TRFO_17297 [Tritrichomonas foetus]